MKGEMIRVSQISSVKHTAYCANTLITRALQPRYWSVEHLAGLALLFIAAALMLNIMPRDYEFLLEPDFDTGTGMYREMFAHLNFSPLRSLSPLVHPYFDAHRLVYGFIGAFIQKLVWFLPSLGRVLPNTASYDLLSANLTNAVAHGLSCWVFFRTMIRINAGIILAFVLALLFCLSPQILQIPLIRIDHLILLPLSVIFYVSVVLTLREARPAHAVALGLALAFLSNLKITGFVFGAIPALAAIILLLQSRERAHLLDLLRFGITVGVIFSFVASALMIRFLALGPQGFITHCLRSLQDLHRWTAVLPVSPRLYYNIDLFNGYGTLFLVIAAVSFLIVLTDAVMTSRSTSLLMIACMVVFSGVGFVTFKYQRGGYHLVPIYLAAIGSATALLRSWAADRMRCAGSVVYGVMIGLLTLPLFNVWTVYGEVAADVKESVIRTEAIWRSPRVWLAGNVASGSKVCLMRHSEWTSVPMEGLGFKVTYGPLDFPYLDRDAMAQFRPPSLDRLAVACDIVILNDWHKSLYLSLFHRMSLEDRAVEWETFLRELEENYPPRVFAFKQAPPGSCVTGCYVSRQEIYDLRPQDRGSVASRN